MTAKEYLKQYHELNKKIEILCEKAARLRCSATRMPCGNIDGMPRSPTYKDGAPFTNIIDEIVQIEKEVDVLVDKRYNLKHQILDCVKQIENKDLRKLLVMRYLSRNRCCWTQIAEAIGVNVNTVKGKLHKKALRELTQYIAIYVDGERNICYNDSVE